VSRGPEERLELRIERLVGGGAGVGRTAGGLVAFVEASAPGDRVRARVIERRPRFVRAEIDELLEAGPGRRPPPCPLFLRCGGCDWLHLTEEAQVAARERILCDALSRIGRFAELPPVEHLRSPRGLAYRARARVVRDGARVGFRARRSHEVVDVEHCAVLDPGAQAQLSALREQPMPGKDEREVRGFADRALGLRVSPGAFFQANAALWQPWQDLVAEVVGSGELAVELYAGVGLYTVRLVGAFRRVIAVERGVAARDLEQNCSAEVIAEPAERFARERLADLRAELVLLNPPRSGCAPEVLDALAAANPPHIVYVSCDPATLARDIARFRESHALARLVSIEAMPQTHHVEALVSLRRR
jgi:23S rRNA (uracil1939-C5)-methyltransferase